MKHYDLAIVGSGAGLVVLEAALNAKVSCAIVEKAKFGGTCLNKGCIPTKMLAYPADVLREALHAKRVGVDFASTQADWDVISERMWRQIGANRSIEAQLSQTENLTVYKGTGAFTGPKTMRVTGADGTEETFEAERFVIAAGARSVTPPIKGIEETGYVVSETFFGGKFPKKPWESLILIGGGPIGAEFAHIFSAMGTRVTLIQLTDRILMTEEEEISEFVKAQFERNGIRVLTGAMATSAEKKDGKKIVTVQDTATKRTFTVEAEEIFLASGVRSNGDSLALERAGVATDAKGWIVTNEYLETSQKNIWALGDINGKFQFRHKANYEAEIIAHNLFHPGEERRKACYRAVPWAIFTNPQVGHVGMTEREAKQAGLRYRVGTNRYSDVIGGRKMGYSKRDPDDGFVKIIADDEKRLLGAHVVGPHAAILVQPFVYLMNAGGKCPKGAQTGQERSAVIEGLRMMCPSLGTYEPIADSMVIHPSLNELTAWALDELGEPD
ncbi:MAG TPA: dihydrolipoyl dehydrogenase [Eubacteriales bacterium]|nr:dihydrolipoyl dehydrogenase [Eubacteriales bacterium]